MAEMAQIAAGDNRCDKQRLLIVCQNQFGYLVDGYYWCKYLKDRFVILYLCWDYGLDRIEADGADILYVSRRGNKAVRLFRFIMTALRTLRSRPFDRILIKYFAGCLLLKIAHPSGKFLLDIRTGSIDRNRFKRFLEDLALRAQAACFKNVTTISLSLAKRLHLSGKAKVLPLGADVIRTTDRSVEGLQLLYVGTLHNRNIEKTLYGLALFVSQSGFHVPARYTIIGSGYAGEEETLRQITKDLDLEEIVTIAGRVPHHRLRPYFDSHNVGVVFVPMTDFFDVQPVTKTFEHIVSGMPVIATATSENRRVVNDRNGVLISDSAEGFCEGLKTLSERMPNFDSAQIKKDAERYHWERIVDDLRHYLLAT